ncbi:MAG: beta-ketoacyl-[acyl-carrier-protein] synthase family protein [Pirellulaceae bacterium]
MDQQTEVVITGLGVVSPIGIGCEALWDSLRDGRSGVKLLPDFQGGDFAYGYGGYIADFEPKQYVKPRKSLKVMGREIQTAFAAAAMAAEQAGVEAGTIDPDRIGVVFGSEMLYGEVEELAGAYEECLAAGDQECTGYGDAAMRHVFPLWMLKYLPNMAACHVAIALDARGPNNTLTTDETSSLAAVIEAMHIIRRGAADAMVVGGTGSRIAPSRMGFSGCQHLARFDEGDPTSLSRPFDLRRNGIVQGEGSAAMMLESRASAESRGAKILGRILGYGTGYEPVPGLREPGEGRSVVRAIRQALEKSGISPDDVGHVNAHGAGWGRFDELEARAIRETLGDVPVTAMKSYFGHLGAGSGAVELVGAVLSASNQLVPRTLNYEQPDPNCPVNVVHGESLELSRPIVLKLSQSTMGHAAALLVEAL